MSFIYTSPRQQYTNVSAQCPIVRGYCLRSKLDTALINLVASSVSYHYHVRASLCVADRARQRRYWSAAVNNLSLPTTQVDAMILLQTEGQLNTHVYQRAQCAHAHVHIAFNHYFFQTAK